MAQLTFDIPKVDEKATRARVKKMFDSYHEDKSTLETMERVNPLWLTHGIVSGPSEKQVAMYPTFDADMIRGGQVRNAEQELTELSELMDARAAHIDKMQNFCKSVERAVESLPHFEREIMERTLMVNKHARKKDFYIWPELAMTKDAYYKHKEKAMLRIAFALRIEVYERAGGGEAA
ncbi:hypothetical protein [Tumebacillus flagellatus]|uniref:ArpU family transcriptional regulator n=1 Tax=Tumebacillus flagellatus TaxID=1157490 RepID=A0A074LF24_9BACL|nr:hypothetical protein [Tumebacillus flagellatus]KEO80846.1 hypothetical protein EL26_24065 [Tumebacillus flagellatus]